MTTTSTPKRRYAYLASAVAIYNAKGRAVVEIRKRGGGKLRKELSEQQLLAHMDECAATLERMREMRHARLAVQG